MRSKRVRQILLVLLVSLLPVTLAVADEASAKQAAQANNPLAKMKAFNVHNYFVSDLTGPTDRTANTLWLRYAQPVGRVLIRASLPVPTVPQADSDLSGLGDFNIFGAYLLSDPDSPRQFGVGPLLVAPTATDAALGTGKWQAGAAAILFDASSPVVQWGGLVTWQGSFAGDDDRDSTSVAAVQPFAIWQLGKGLYLRSTPIWVYNLETNSYHMPFSLGIGKVVRVGDTVFNMFAEPQVTFLHRGNGQPSTQLFIGLNMQFVN